MLFFMHTEKYLHLLPSCLWVPQICLSKTLWVVFQTFACRLQHYVQLDIAGILSALTT